MGTGYVRKRGDGAYQIAVYLGRKLDGRDDYDYKTVHVETEKEAKRLALVMAAKVAEGKYIRAGTMTVEQLLTSFLAAKEPPEVKQSTYDFYEKIARLHWIPDMGGKRVSKLRKSEVRDYCRQKVKDGMSPSTARHIYETLRTAINFAVEDGELPDNPLRGMKAPHVPDRPFTVWDAVEAAQFLASTQNHRLHAAWLLALTTGMRRGEILGLRRRDLDLDGMKLQIEQQLVVNSNGVRIESPKSEKSRRTVELGSMTVEALRQRLIDQSAERRFTGDRYQDSGLVFTTMAGGPIHPTSYDKQFERAIQRAGVPRIRVHDTRHTHITLALEHGENLNAVSARSGHADPGVTVRKYAHVMPTMGRVVADGIETVYEQAISAKKVKEQTLGEVQ